MTPPGIEPATFRFVAQHLNHCATAVMSENYFCKSKRQGYQSTAVSPTQIKIEILIIHYAGPSGRAV